MTIIQAILMISFLGKVCAGHYWRFHWVGRISRPVAGLVVTWHCRSDDFIVQNSGTGSQIINTTYLIYIVNVQYIKSIYHMCNVCICVYITLSTDYKKSSPVNSRNMTLVPSHPMLYIS